MAKDMMTRMLEGLVDYALERTGQTKESIADAVNGFLNMSNKVTLELKQIREDQRKILELLDARGNNGNGHDYNGDSINYRSRIDDG